MKHWYYNILSLLSIQAIVSHLWSCLVKLVTYMDMQLAVVKCFLLQTAGVIKRTQGMSRQMLILMIQGSLKCVKVWTLVSYDNVLLWLNSSAIFTISSFCEEYHLIILFNCIPVAVNISCVSGSVPRTCIHAPPGAGDTQYSGCYPTILPCYIDGRCLEENCSNSGYTIHS